MANINNRLFGDENEKFVGVKQNKENAERYLKILQLGKRLAKPDDGMNSFKLEATNPKDNTSQNCIIYIDAESPVLLMSNLQRSLLGQMVFLSDVFVTTVTEDKQHIRYTFSVTNVWSA